MASIFSKIINGEIPGHFVWKDSLCFSILTIQPICPGHLLVVPREEIDHWDDVAATTAAHLIQVSQKIAKAIKQVFPCKRVGLMIAGLEVPHTHIHLLPVNNLNEFNFKLAHEVPQDELTRIASSLRQVLLQLGNQEARLDASMSSKDG